MTPTGRLVFRAMSLLGIIPALVGTFVLSRYLMTRMPPSTLPEQTLLGFTVMAAAAGAWLLRHAPPVEHPDVG